MSATTHERNERNERDAIPCIGCGADVAPGMLECPQCHRLVHAFALTALAQEAKSAGARGDATAELAAWRRALELLPQGTTQRATIEARMQAVSRALHDPTAKEKPAPAAGGKGQLGVAGAVAAAALKGKAFLALFLANGKLLLLGLFKLPTLFSMMVYGSFLGGRSMALGLGIVGSIYVHEMGHVASLRRYGIEASAPMFIPGFGAVIRMKQYPTDAAEEARTGLAGPLWGLGAAIVALGVGFALSSPLLLQIASFGAMVNLFNLIPLSITTAFELDGARGLKALSVDQRRILGGVALAIGLVSTQLLPAIIGVIVLIRSSNAQAKALPRGDVGVLQLFVALIALHALVGFLAGR